MIRKIGPVGLGPARHKLDRYLGGAHDVPIVDEYRAEARQKLGEKCTPKQVEMAALALFERDLSRLPRSLTVLNEGSSVPGIAGGQACAGVGPARGLRRGVSGSRAAVDPPPLRSLCQSDAYLSTLAASLAGQNAALTPAILKALDDFKGELLFQTVDKDRKLGMMAEAADVAPLVGVYEVSGGAQVTGCWSEQEARLVDQALETMAARLPGSAGLVKSVVMRTHLGASVNEREETVELILGLYMKTRPGEIHLLRERVFTEPEGLMRTVYHEAGHELEKGLNLKNSPFGSGEFVSAYARTNCHEDFAETHADLVHHWDKYQANPERYLSDTDDLGRKRRWILEVAYGQAVGAPVELGYLFHP
jgi:hypothetical protein